MRTHGIFAIIALGLASGGCTPGDVPDLTDTDGSTTAGSASAGSADETSSDDGSLHDWLDSGSDSTSTPIPEPAEICDGSADLRLAITLPTPEERVEPITYLRWENGARFLFVRGDCTYWVSAPDNPTLHERMHTGVLTAQDEAELAADLHYGQWEAMGLVGYWHPSLGDFDVPTAVFYDGVNAVVCEGGCGAEWVVPEVQAMRDLEQPWVERLWESGSVSTEPLRVEALRYADNDPTHGAIDKATWPLATSLERLAYPDEDAIPSGPGHGRLLDAADSAALVSIWEEYLSGDHGGLWQSYGSIPFVDGNGAPVYRVVLRDTMPFEDAMGLVSIPLP